MQLSTMRRLPTCVGWAIWLVVVGCLTGSAFGQTGPRRGMPGYDIIALALDQGDRLVCLSERQGLKGPQEHKQYNDREQSPFHAAPPRATCTEWTISCGRTLYLGLPPFKADLQG